VTQLWTQFFQVYKSNGNLDGLKAHYREVAVHRQVKWGIMNLRDALDGLRELFANKSHVDASGIVNTADARIVLDALISMISSGDGENVVPNGGWDAVLEIIGQPSAVSEPPVKSPPSRASLDGSGATTALPSASCSQVSEFFASVAGGPCSKDTTPAI